MVVGSVLGGALSLSGVRVAQAAEPAGAQAQDEASAHFRRGLDLFKEADFRGALIELRRANQIAPSYRILYNIGQCYLELQDYAGALRSFQAYLAEGGAKVPRDRRAAVEGDIQKLQGRVATVDLTTNVEGAEVRVDDDVVGTTPLGRPVLVGAGRRRITIEKSGVAPATKIVDVAGGDHLALSLPVNLQAPAAPAAPAPPAAAPPPAPPPAANTNAPAAAPPPPPPPAEPSSPSYVWIGWTVTGVLAAGGIGTGIAALAAKHDSDEKLATVPGNAADIHDAHQSTVLFSALADGLGAAAVVAGAVSLYFTLKSPKADAHAGAATSSLRLGITGDRVVLQGSF